MYPYFKYITIKEATINSVFTCYLPVDLQTYQAGNGAAALESITGDGTKPLLVEVTLR